MVVGSSTKRHGLRPNAEGLVWSDMFDLHHNAHDNYHFVHGSLADSRKGLDSSVGIVNWSGGKTKSALTRFADRSQHQIIAGYYDDGVSRNVDRWKQAARRTKGVNDFMSTTWRQNSDTLEAFAMCVFMKALEKRSILPAFH